MSENRKKIKYEITIFGKKYLFHIQSDFRSSDGFKTIEYVSESDIQNKLDELNNNLEVEKIEVKKVVLEKCDICKKFFPEEYMSGRFCLRCEKINYDAQQEMRQEEMEWQNEIR